MSKLEQRLKELQIEGYNPKTETWSPPQTQNVPNNSAGLDDEQITNALSDIELQMGQLADLKSSVIGQQNQIKEKINNQWWPFGGKDKLEVDKPSAKQLEVSALIDMHRKNEQLRGPDGSPTSVAELISGQDRAKKQFQHDLNKDMMGGSVGDLQTNILSQINQGQASQGNRNLIRDILLMTQLR